MSNEVITRECLSCGSPFETSNPTLEYCSPSCVEASFNALRSDVNQRETQQMSALSGLLNACTLCGKTIEAFTIRGTRKIFCGPVCSARGAREKVESVYRPCIHCDTPVLVPNITRLDFVRCPKHKEMWPTLKKQGTKNIKDVRAADAPFDQYFMRGPWWDSGHKAMMILLMHSGSTARREMEYARYLLSVKEGRRLRDDVPLSYIDGDRTNVALSNLVLSDVTLAAS